MQILLCKQRSHPVESPDPLFTVYLFEEPDHTGPLTVALVSTTLHTNLWQTRYYF